MNLARTVGALGHACTGCGGSCHGVRVRLVDAEERARIVAIGAELGVADPVVDERIRFDGGRCVFLDAAGCRIHAARGASAKPAICRQYPLVVTDTGASHRVGVDPGCYSAWVTRSAPDLRAEGALAHTVRLDPAAEANEAAVLGILSAPGQTVAGALAALVGRDPARFAGPWITAVQAARLEALLQRPEAGAAVRQALGPVLAHARTLDAAAPPAWSPAPEVDAWALDVARRVVGLRLAASVPLVQAVALLMLGGALLVGWSEPAPDGFARGIAGWSRAVRAPIFWQALIPDPAALRRLVG